MNSRIMAGATMEPVPAEMSSQITKRSTSVWASTSSYTAIQISVNVFWMSWMSSGSSV